MSPTIVKNNISVTGIAELTVTTTMLQAASTGIADDKLLFTIDSLPSQGGLKLNGTALAVKGTFTQADINAGKLTYLPSGTTATMDGFGFTVTDGTTTAIPGSTQRVSISSSGTQGNDISGNDTIGTVNLVKNSISADGRYVAYESLASNLAAGDTNGKYDIFVYDRQTGSNQRVSVSSNGSEGNRDSIHPAISADGRYVTFQSKASNLVAGDTNTNGAQTNVFVRDLQTGTTELVSVNSSGVQSTLGGGNPVISADGRYVTFSSFSANLIPGDTSSYTSGNLFIRDRQVGTTKLVSADPSGNLPNDVAGADSLASVSVDGRYVAFDARASNLVAGDTNNYRDVFVRDVQTGTTQRVSVDNSGNQLDRASNNPVITADGKSVAFYALSTNTAQTTIFVRDLVAGTTTAIASGSLLQQGAGLATSADGRFIAYVDGSSGSFALKIYDRQAKVTDEVANVPYSSPFPSLAGFSISANGEFVAFSSGSPLVASDTNNIADVFVRDRGAAASISATTATAAITITPKIVTPPNQAPIVANPIATQSIIAGSPLNFSLAANTFTDPDTGDVLNYSAKLANGNNLPTWLTFDSVTRTFAGTPTASDAGNLSIAVTATDKAGLTAASNFALNIAGATTAPVVTTPVVTPTSSSILIPGVTVANNLFTTDATIKGFGISALTQKLTNKVNEIGMFAVDDLTGKIGSFAPGSAGYLKAVLDIARPIFTTLAGDFLNKSNQEFSIDPNKTYQFFEIQDGSIDELKQQIASDKNPTNLIFSLPDTNGNSPIKVTNNSKNNGYKISVNADELVLNVVKLAGADVTSPIGSKSQNLPEGRTIDLTDYTGKTLKVDIITSSSAAYNNNVGFYAVEDAIGTIKLANGNSLKPGDTNYAIEAIKSALTNSLQAGKTDSKTGQDIVGGKIYAPIVVTQGTFNDFIAKNPTNGGGANDIHAYFNYLGANSDNVDHFRLIGQNTFGVEDIYGGGDRDFNDLVVKMNVKTVA
jgi:Putative Ig domain/Cadherin-like/Domain of unknown function (DUF4114)/WD40-like Beta Propeller Repeat